MKICVLNDPEWGGFEPDSYLIGYDWEMRDLHKATVVMELRELVHQGYDVFLNPCDGAWDEDRPGIEVPQALEYFNVPFTGAEASFFEPTRDMMKRVCNFYGIQSPAGIFVDDANTIERTLAGLRFPLLVKHPNSYASVGLTKESKVDSADQLRVQVDRTVKRFGGALVEEFIEGREFSVLISENPDDPAKPIAFDPVEFRFPPGESFKHENIKWVTYNDMKCIPVDQPDLVARLQDMSIKMFLGLNGSGYGRCDVRMNAEGELFMLEINPNGAVFYPPNEPGTADHILKFDPRGHKFFVENLFRSAFSRHARRQTKWVVRFDLREGFGTYASKPVSAGETIISFEGQPHILMSKSFVRNNWSQEDQELFFRHAYPLTDEIYVMWEKDPSQWKPLNHACDPNAWFEGLNVVARRDIQPGEQITMDYSMFFGEEMPLFECHCDSPTCRGIIRGTDYLEPFVKHYGEHVSAYVFEKRQKIAI
jgi:D-alanine-D-alanine ligase-like ATP-grasp enzyme